MNTFSTIRKYYLFLLGFFFLSIQVKGQVAGSFDIFIINNRFGPKPIEYFSNNGFKSAAKFMSESVITSNKTTVNIPTVRAWLDKYIPSTTSTDYLILDWETGPYDDLRNYPLGSLQFITAENELLKLINEVKSYRPNIKISIYQMPYRVNTTQQNNFANAPGKFDKIFARLDFICPSVYIEKPDEEVGHESNLRFIKFNLDVALPLGKQFNKPVYPFVWHKVHPINPIYSEQIIQKEVFAEYLKYIYGYSLNGIKANGVWWWDGLSSKLNGINGINDHLLGTITDEASYDALIVDYAKYVKQVLVDASVQNFTITDKTAPIVTGVIDGGIYNISKRIAFDEGAATLNNKPFSNGGTVTAEGAYNLVVKDQAGNVTDIKFIIDITKPTGTLLINNNAKETNTTNVTLTLTYQGNPVEMRLKGSGAVAWGSWEPVATTKNWTLEPGSGTKTVSVQFRDAASNISASSPYDAIALKLPTALNLPALTMARQVQEVKEEVLSKSVAVYPNPAIDLLHVEVNEAGSGETIINLLDLAGQVVLTQKVNTTTNLATALVVNQMQPGVYLLSINSPKGRTSKRIVIQ